MLALAALPTACSVYDASLIGARDGGGAAGSGGIDASIGPTGGSAPTAGHAGVSGGGASAGDAGDASAGGAPADPIVGSEAARSLALELIDDLEDGNTQVKVYLMRNGYWYADGDKLGVTLTPSPFLPTSLAAEDRHIPESIHSAFMHVEQKGGWGSTMGFQISTRTRGYDGSAYCGLRFVARSGPEALGAKLVVVNRLDDTGTMSPAFEYVMGLTPEWRDYRILFSELTTPIEFDVTRLYQVSLYASKIGTYEMAVDDVCFLLKPEGGVCP